MLRVLQELRKLLRFFRFAGQHLGDARLHVGAAQLPEEFRKVLKDHLKKQAQGRRSNENKLLPHEIHESFTAVRRQTAVDEATGAPEKGSLRSLRVILRNITFLAPLTFTEKPDDCAKGLLAACALSLRRAGEGRNRGRGRLKVRLLRRLDERYEDITESCFKHFCRIVGGERA